MQRNSRETTAGSIETQRNSRETTAEASTPRPRPTTRAVAFGNLSSPPQKMPEEATRGRNLRKTTAGASKCNGIRAKTQREHRNATEFARNHSGSVETKAPSHTARRCGRQPKWPPQERPEEATRGRTSRQTTGGASKCNGIRTKPQRQHRNAMQFTRNHSGSVETKDPSHRARRCGWQPKWPSQKSNLSGPPRRGLKRPREAGIRTKPQREHRNATEFARNHSGSIETQRNSRETTARASKPRTRCTARTVAVGNLSRPPRRRLKRPREAGICAKPQREHRNATEFAGDHSGSIETQRNSRETTAGASKPRPRLTAHAVAVGNLSGPPRRGLKRPREAGIRAKPQGEHRNATEFARNHSGSIETQRNSRETTAGASKPRPRPTAARAVAVSNQFLYSERKNPIAQALFGEKRKRKRESKRKRKRTRKRTRKIKKKKEKDKEKEIEKEKERKKEKEQEKEQEQEQEQEQEKENKRTREQENKRTREQENKRAREQENKRTRDKRTREQENKRTREQETKKTRTQEHKNTRTQEHRNKKRKRKSPPTPPVEFWVSQNNKTMFLIGNTTTLPFTGRLATLVRFAETLRGWRASITQQESDLRCVLKQVKPRPWHLLRKSDLFPASSKHSSFLTPTLLKRGQIQPKVKNHPLALLNRSNPPPSPFKKTRSPTPIPSKQG